MKNAVSAVVVFLWLYLGAVADSFAQGDRRPGFISIDSAGRVTAINGLGHDYAASTPPGILLQIKEAGKLIAPTTAHLIKNNILLVFPDGKSATIKYENKPA